VLIQLRKRNHIVDATAVAKFQTILGWLQDENEAMDWRDCQTDCEDGLKEILQRGRQILDPLNRTLTYSAAGGSLLGAAPQARILRSALSRQDKPEALKACAAVLENLVGL
jgi:hypothetical protein